MKWSDIQLGMKINIPHYGEVTVIRKHGSKAVIVLLNNGKTEAILKDVIMRSFVDI